MIRHLLATAFVIALATTANVAAENVEGPIYKSWSKSKVGTSVTVKSVTVMKGQRVESTLRYTLLELTPAKAVVEMVVTSKGVENRPQRLEHRRDFPLMAGMKKEDIGKPPADAEQGEETINVAGKDYKAQWYDIKSRVEAGEAIARTWTTPEFPGMLLKSVLRVPAADKVTTLEVVEYKIP